MHCASSWFFYQKIITACSSYLSMHCVENRFAVHFTNSYGLNIYLLYLGILLFAKSSYTWLCICFIKKVTLSTLVLSYLFFFSDSNIRISFRYVYLITPNTNLNVIFNENVTHVYSLISSCHNVYRGLNPKTPHTFTWAPGVTSEHNFFLILTCFIDENNPFYRVCSNVFNKPTSPFW